MAVRYWWVLLMKSTSCIIVSTIGVEWDEMKRLSTQRMSSVSSLLWYLLEQICLCPLNSLKSTTNTWKATLVGGTMENGGKTLRLTFLVRWLGQVPAEIFGHDRSRFDQVFPSPTDYVLTFFWCSINKSGVYSTNDSTKMGDFHEVLNFNRSFL
jgi:hypothetical protein